MEISTDMLQRLYGEVLEEINGPLSATLHVPESDLLALGQTCGEDEERLRRCIKRRISGDPVAYILGYVEFRGQRFKVDRRTYITDPETSYLVDVVIEKAQEFYANTQRPPVILEVGLGCGSLSISVKKVLQEKARVAAVDIDAGALEVAKENMRNHGTDIEWYESDLFRSLPESFVPDILFGDPPWGNEKTMYDEDRPLEHYLTMPYLAVFPIGNCTAVHERIIRQVQERGWEASLLLNTGVLEDEHLGRLGRMTRGYTILRPTPTLSILYCKA